MRNYFQIKLIVKLTSATVALVNPPQVQTVALVNPPQVQTVALVNPPQVQTVALVNPPVKILNIISI